MRHGANVHVIDADSNRGTEMARILSARSFCVEVHEGMSGFLSHPSGGVILMSDDHDGPEPEKALEAIEESTGYMPAALFTSSLSPRRVFRAMTAGLVDYFEWPCSPTELGEIVVRLIIQGERRAKLEALQTQARERVEQLFERERDVLCRLVAGASLAEIAEELGIGRRTAEISRAHMMAQLGASTVTDAVRIGIYAGLDEPNRDLKGAAPSRAGSLGEAPLAH